MFTQIIHPKEKSHLWVITTANSESLFEGTERAAEKSRLERGSFAHKRLATAEDVKKL